MHELKCKTNEWTQLKRFLANEKQLYLNRFSWSDVKDIKQRWLAVAVTVPLHDFVNFPFICNTERQTLDYNAFEIYQLSYFILFIIDTSIY